MNYLYYDKELEYPKPQYDYSPSELYPEYVGGTIAKEKNFVYEAIRNIFIANKMDIENYGTVKWNPLGNYIKPGNVVLVKPNLVLHQNNLRGYEDSLDCLVTHPSIIRCILDYVLIALKGKGHVFVGDSPVKDCDLEALLEKHHYNVVRNYYRDFECIKWVDLRGPDEERTYDTDLKGVLVNLGELSYFYNYNNQEGLRIPNYDYRKVSLHHRDEIQEYCVNELVMRADVIINLPKPKTHRKSGFTGSLKNFVGINYSKEYLPHHTVGDKSVGGDEFFEQTLLKKLISDIRTKRDIIRNQSSKHRNNKIYKIMAKTEGLIKRIDNKLFSKDDMDRVTEGTWYKNDTLWRTVLDLNKVVHYADLNGFIHKKKQRTVISLCDMIISGEKEGPLAPSPKKESVLLFGENGVELDAILVKLMHFDIDKLPSIKVALEDNLLESKSYENILIDSNIPQYKGFLKDMEFSDFSPFQAAIGWAGYIEEKLMK